MILGLSAITSTVIAQSTFLPLNTRSYHILDRIEIKSGYLDELIHTSTKPYVRLNAVLYAETANDMNARFKPLDRHNQYFVYKDNSEWTPWGLMESKKPFLKHFYKYRTDFFHLNKQGDFLFKFNPVFQFQLGKEFGTDGIKYVNTRGFEARGMISEKLGFYGFFSDNQLSYPTYAHERIWQDVAVPGEGRYKLFISEVGDNLFANGVDFYSSRGYITYQPIERIRIQFGRDQNFIGDGVRSLFLSDFSNNMLFLKVQTQVWKFNYQNLFTQLTRQFDQHGDGLLSSKYAAIHHLSFQATKWLNIGVFESVVFDRENHFELDYLNPLILYRAVEFQLGSPDNVILGLDYKINFLKKFSLYGQFVVDEFRFGEVFSGDGWWANKFGMQMGLKYIDIADITNLDAQIEFNTVRPYTYSHNSDVGNYTHYNLPLAHPLGANFREFLGIIRYQPKKDYHLKLNLMYAQKGMDTDSTSNFGGNIFLDNDTHPNDFGNSLLQGNKQNIFLADFVFSYMWKHNLFFDISYTYRNQNSELNTQDRTDNFIGFGMRLNMNRKELLY